MPGFAEEQLREMYGYPEDMTYDEYAESERKRAYELIEKGDGEAAVEILRKLADCIRGDREACEKLGSLYAEGKVVEKDPWKSMLFYCAALSDKGDKESQLIWAKLQGFRTMLLNTRPLGVLKLNPDDVESACCELMKNQMIAGNVSMSEIDDNPDECAFSMTMEKKDYKRYIGKERHEVMQSPDPNTVTPMDLKKCPYCGANLCFTKEKSREWVDLVNGAL